MDPVVADPPRKKRNMANKKKPTGGSHQTPRINVGFPGEWHAYIRKQAAKKKQPVLWYLMDLVSRDEDAEGDPPPFPWEEEVPK
jgi:hypothetical protein